jgi:hypothetical protein
MGQRKRLNHRLAKRWRKRLEQQRRQKPKTVYAKMTVLDVLHALIFVMCSDRLFRRY